MSVTTEVGTLTILTRDNNAKYDCGYYRDKGCFAAWAYKGRKIKCCECPFPDCLEMYNQTVKCRANKFARLYPTRRIREEIDKLFALYPKIT